MHDDAAGSDNEALRWFFSAQGCLDCGVLWNRERINQDLTGSSMRWRGRDMYFLRKPGDCWHQWAVGSHIAVDGSAWLS